MSFCRQECSTCVNRDLSTPAATRLPSLSTFFSDSFAKAVLCFPFEEWCAETAPSSPTTRSPSLLYSFCLPREALIPQHVFLPWSPAPDVLALGTDARHSAALLLRASSPACSHCRFLPGDYHLRSLVVRLVPDVQSQAPLPLHRQRAPLTTSQASSNSRKIPIQPSTDTR